MNDQFKAMNEQFAKQAQEFLQSAQGIQMPTDIQSMSGDAVEQARESYAKLEVLSQEIKEAMEQVSQTAQKSSLILSDKITDNLQENTDAVMAAVNKISSAQSLPEAIAAQTEFVQAQVAKAGEQSKELYQLGTKVAKDAADQWSKAANKAMKPSKKS